MANSAFNSAILNSMMHGQCRFEYVSTSVCRLSRLNGRYLIINGVPQEIPSAGVDLANTALGANDTTYYVYAYMSAGVMTLEASATAYATDSTYGHKIKSGDATRTLVGMVRKNGGNFVDSTTTRFVLSWHNRRLLGLTVTSGAVALNSTPTELARINFLTWGDSGAPVSSSLHGYNTGSATYIQGGLGLDSGASASYTGYCTATPQGSVTNSVVWVPAEGYHFATLMGNVDASTGNSQIGSHVSGSVQG